MKKLLACLLPVVTFMFGNNATVESPKEITRVWEEKFLAIKYDVTTLNNHVLEMTNGLINQTQMKLVIFIKIFSNILILIG